MAPPPWANKQQAPQTPQQQGPQATAATVQPPQQQAVSDGRPAAAEVDYCPRVVPQQALSSGAKNAADASVPDLAQLKQKAAAGRRKWTEEALRATDALIPLQNGTNRWFSQKGMTGFGMPRDVHGKHVHRLVDEMFPEAASQYQQEANRFIQDKSDY
uniref:Bromo domain-containing protein n=1 Tax=Romanomermis culicivorax TaxID=13658 RepID=A0A915KNC3_ROMCU